MYQECNQIFDSAFWGVAVGITSENYERWYFCGQNSTPFSIESSDEQIPNIWRHFHGLTPSRAKPDSRQNFFDCKAPSAVGMNYESLFSQQLNFLRIVSVASRVEILLKTSFTSHSESSPFNPGVEFTPGWQPLVYMVSRSSDFSISIPVESEISAKVWFLRSR